MGVGYSDDVTNCNIFTRGKRDAFLSSQTVIFGKMNFGVNISKYWMRTKRQEVNYQSKIGSYYPSIGELHPQNYLSF